MAVKKIKTKIASAKAHKYSLKRRQINKKWRIKLEKTLRKSGNIPEIYKVIDQSAKLGIIHKNKAARLKAKMTKRLKSKSQTQKIVKSTSPKGKKPTKKKATKVAPKSVKKSKIPSSKS